MNFRDLGPSKRPEHCHTCACGPRETAAKLQAARYAATLTDGDDVDGDFNGTDYEYIKSFSEYLPEALVSAGFLIHARLEGGRVIQMVKRKDAI